MAEFFKKIYFLLLLVISFLAFSCLGPWPGAKGKVIIYIDGPESASRFPTIVPDIEVDYYILGFDSFNGQPTQEEDIEFAAGGQISCSLAAGVWDLSLSAFSSNGVKVAEASVSGVSINIGQSTTVDVSLIPIEDGYGSIDISLSVNPPGDVTINDVDYSLKRFAGGSFVEVTGGPGLVQSGNTYRLLWGSLQAGNNYQLTFTVDYQRGGQSFSPIVMEGAVYIYTGITTVGTVEVTSSDFGSSAPYGTIIADHTAVEGYDNIPAYWMNEVKKMLFVMGGESHGRAYMYGLELLANEDSDLSVVTHYGASAPPSYTESNLRASRAYRFGGSWSNSMGEEDCFTNSSARTNVRTGISYMDNNYSGRIVQGFGWCWDMSWGAAPSSQKDPAYGCGWAGTSVGGPDGNKRWGLDSGDSSITGNSVCMQTYLDAVSSYNNIEGSDVVFVYTTGPVDGYPGENNYQRYIKHEFIRDYVNENGGVLFDYADILSWNYNTGSETTATWNDHTFPSGNPVLATGGTGYNRGHGGCHISADGCRVIAKASVWMLARIAGWDGN